MNIYKEKILESFLHAEKNVRTIRLNGRVTRVIGLLIESLGPEASIGELCYIFPRNKKEAIRAEVIGFRDNSVLLMPLGEIGGISPGARVMTTGAPLQVPVSEKLIGRVLNGLGEPMDDKGEILNVKKYSIYNKPPNPLKRRRIKESLSVGVRAIDGIITIGKGQRMGIFSGSGVGKSTLMGMIARNTTADVNVVALVGERGKELRDVIERDLGEEGMNRSVLVVATSDEPALVRLKAAFVATAIAEFFRDQGKDVMLMMDSVTRFAMAQREIGISTGESPTTKAYPPSVFALMPKLMERAGTSDKGSITALYTVLVEGDDMDEPIADTARGILDGHIVLSRKIAARNHYPAIDILESVSRVMLEIANQSHIESANKLKKVLADYYNAIDLINVGAYVKGTNPDIDFAIDKIKDVNSFLRQGVFEKADYDDTLEKLIKMFL
jgi:flagellum-specific ATP synthase